MGTFLNRILRPTACQVKFGDRREGRLVQERRSSLSSSEEWCAKVQLSDRLELNLTSGTIPIL